MRRTKFSARRQRTQRLQLYGLVQGFSYVIGLNDFKITQHLRARLAGVLRRPLNLPKPLDDDLEELFEISGLWVRNVGDRHRSTSSMSHSTFLRSKNSRTAARTFDGLYHG